MGDGFSGVSVSGGALFTSWDEGDEQYLVSLDAATGEEHWRRSLGAGFENRFGNGPRSTPLVGGEIVYAVGTQGMLLAAKAETGEVIWGCDLVEVFEARLPTYGYSSSPMIASSCTCAPDRMPWPTWGTPSK